MTQAATNARDVIGRPDELSERLGYLLKHVQVRFQTIQGQALSPLGLDGRLLAVLVAAEHRGPCHQLRLAESLGVDRTTMVDLVDRLESAGFVNRRPDPDDRRARLVDLTPKGRKALNAGLARSDEVEGRFLAALSDHQQAAFRRALKRLIE